MLKTATEEPAEDHEAGEIHSPEEVHSLISQFTELDKLRVQRAAMYFSKRCRLEWPDLENEAMVRTLDGRRKCPKNVAVTTFLGNVIRSIASETDPRDWSVPLSDDLEALQASAGGTTDLMNPSDPASSTMDAQKILEEVISTFEDDEKSLMILKE